MRRLPSMRPPQPTSARARRRSTRAGVERAADDDPGDAGDGGELADVVERADAAGGEDGDARRARHRLGAPEIRAAPRCRRARCRCRATAAAPAAAASRASAVASRSSTRFQPSTATVRRRRRPPTMIRSAKRAADLAEEGGIERGPGAHHRPARPGARAPRSHRGQRRAGRRPPATGMSTRRDDGADEVGLAGGPPNAPSRSTTCSRARALRLPAAGPWPPDPRRTRSRPRRLPWRSRTQRPPREVDGRDDREGHAAAPVAHEGGEVLEEPEAPALALLGVELGREERAAADRRGERHPVVHVATRQRGVGRRRVVGVHEVEVRAARDAVEERPGRPGARPGSSPCAAP